MYLTQSPKVPQRNKEFFLTAKIQKDTTRFTRIVYLDKIHIAVFLLIFVEKYFLLCGTWWLSDFV